MPATGPTTNPLLGLAVGMRAVLRHHVPGGLTDSVGIIEVLGAEAVSVDTPHGLEVIAVADITLAKQVPPRPSRRGAPHRAISIADLERIMIDEWPTVERERLGSWVLRAGDSCTRMANSLLPLGDPGLPLEEAVSAAQRWYAARDLPCVVSLYGPAGFVSGDDPLGAELLGRGFTESGRTAVLTAATAPTRGADRTILVERQHPAGSPERIFLRADRAGQTVGVARVAFAHVWAGVFAVHVDSAHRRQGLAGALLAAATREAQERGIRSVYAQVQRDNQPSLALFEQVGFSTHHEYCYLSGPATSPCR